MASKGAWWKAVMWGWVVIVLAGCNGEGRAAKEITPSAGISNNTVSLTARPTLTRVPTWTPLPPTLTPLPTLPPVEAEALVLELLETNGGCDLPCWWGITPEKSNFPDAVNQLLRIAPDGMVWSEDENEIGFFFPIDIYEQGNSLSDIWIIIYGKNLWVANKVGRISVELRIFPTRILPYRIFREYYIDRVLQKYDNPSSVYIHVSPPMEPDSPVGYSIRIVYSSIGVAFQYEGLSDPGEIIQICPEYNFVITIDLQSPENSRNLGVPDELSKWFNISEATNLTPESFYQLFIGGKENVCFETMDEIWR